MGNPMIRRLLIAAALALAVAPPSASAQSVTTFIGGSGSTSTSQQSWTQPGNWDTGVVPTSITVAPGFTKSAVTKQGRPSAATS